MEELEQRFDDLAIRNAFLHLTCNLMKNYNNYIVNYLLRELFILLRLNQAIHLIIKTILNPLISSRKKRNFIKCLHKPNNISFIFNKSLRINLMNIYNFLMSKSIEFRNKFLDVLKR